MSKARTFNTEAILSILEQLTLNFGNFVFFILSANLVGVKQFGLFGLLLVGAKVVHSLAVQWILLPITSKNIGFGNQEILKQIKKKMLILSVSAPFFIFLYSILLSNNNINIIQLSVTYALGILMILHDISRYYLIRLRKVRLLLVANLFRWAIAFSFLYIFVNNNEQYINVLYVFSVSIGISFIVQVVYIKSKYNSSDNKQNNKAKDNNIKYDNPLLHLGVANVFNSIAVAMLFNKVNIAAFGALLAFQSLVNIFPFIMQFLETHYSAMMVAKNQEKFLKNKWLLFYLLAVIPIVLLLSFYGDSLIGVIYSDEYVKYHLLLVLLFATSSIQSLSRLLSVQLRLQYKYKPFFYSSIVLWVSTIVLFVLSLFLEKLNYQAIVFIVLITALLQMFVYMTTDNVRLKKEIT